MHSLYQVATSWIAFDNLRTSMLDIINKSGPSIDAFLNVETLLKSHKNRHCILIERDERQYKGQQSRISNWEDLSSPSEESDVNIGNFQFLTSLFKAKEGNNKNLMCHKVALLEVK